MLEAWNQCFELEHYVNNTKKNKFYQKENHQNLLCF